MKIAKNKLFLIICGCIIVLISVGLLFWQNYIGAKQQQNYDIVVVGAGPGGIAASIQAARMGAHVALLEPTDWIGGQITAAGVGSMDEGSIKIRSYGIYKDFVQRVRAYYGARNKSIDTCYYGVDSICVAPEVGEVILKQMLQNEAQHLQVFTNTTVATVVKQGNTVTGVTTNNGQYNAKVVIDADEYGDVLAKAGAGYRLGNGTSYDNIPSTACVQSITYAAVVKKYLNGLPTDLQFKQPPPGYSASIAKHFASVLAKDGYEHFSSGGRSPANFPSYVAYRGLPDISNPHNYNSLQKNGQVITRTALNLGNDYPVTGNLSTAFIDNPTYRAQTICKAKLLTLQLIYYIQHDLGQSDWSIANDAGYDTGYNRSQHCQELNGYEAFEVQMPVEPYVREARRLIGMETLTGAELALSWQDPKQTATFNDSVAIGYYPMDLHQCRQTNTLEPTFDAPEDISSRYAGGAFEVPMGAVIPQQVDGLLAAEKNISVSRQAEGAIREQPVAMDIGQAVGVLAALSIQKQVQPRFVNPSSVQSILHAAHIPTAISIH